MRPQARGRRARPAVGENERLRWFLRASTNREGDRVDEVERRTSKDYPIYADFVPEGHTKTLGRLGMTLAPGMKADTTHG